MDTEWSLNAAEMAEWIPDDDLEDDEGAENGEWAVKTAPMAKKHNTLITGPMNFPTDFDKSDGEKGARRPDPWEKGEDPWNSRATNKIGAAMEKGPISSASTLSKDRPSSYAIFSTPTSSSKLTSASAATPATTGIASLAEEFRKMNEKVERRNVLEIIRQGNEFASREDASHPADDARQSETRAGQVFSIATPPDRERGMAERRWATRIAKEEVESNDGDEYMPPPGLDNRKRRALRRGRSATRRGRRGATEEKTEEATPRRSPISKEVGEPTPVPGDVAARPQENTGEAQTQTDVALPLRVEAVWQCHCVGAEAVVDAP